MSKHQDVNHDAELSAASPIQEQIEFADDDESFPIYAGDSPTDELKTFTTTYGLQHKLDVFRKAAQLLQGEAPEDIPGLTDIEIESLRDESSHKWRQPKLLYFTILVCSVGAMEQGWAQTAMNGANLTFPEALGIGSDSTRDNFILGLINSGIYLSVGLWGAWLSEPLNNRLGRRGTIFTGSVFCLVANLGSSLSWNWQVLLFFRLLLGTGLGINASTVSVFAAECAPASIRGGLAVSWQMWTAFGIFLGFTANVLLYNHGSKTWRLQLAAPFIPTIPLLLMVYTCPESPAWHIKSERYNQAYLSLQRLRNTDLQAARELYATYLQQQSRSTNNPKPLTTTPNNDNPLHPKPTTTATYLTRLLQLFTTPRIRNATLASYTVMLSQQLCGINIIAFYSSTIFLSSGFTPHAALLASCIFGLVNFLGAIPAIWTMDTLGRRSLLLWTLPVMSGTLVAAALTFRLPSGTAAQFGLLATLIYVFCAVYSPGMGPVPSAYSAEVFPLSHREVGMSLAVATANFWAAVLSVTFPGLLSGLGSEGTFELYGVLNLVAWVLVYLFVRETKRRTLDELDEVFGVGLREYVRFLVFEEVPWCWRRFVLRRGDVGDLPVLGRAEYRELGQADDME